MKTYSPKSPACHVRVPAFLPVRGRRRADGWTALRQAAFLVALARTGSVSRAAREVGMARETAYRLRTRAGAESFAATWDHVLGHGAAQRAKVTPGERARRALEGLIKPMVYSGEFTGITRKADNTALLGFLAQLERGLGVTGIAAERSRGFAPRPASPSPLRQKDA